MSLFNLRYYQEESIDALFDYWGNGGQNPLVDLATGTGKSVVVATTARRAIEAYPDMRILGLVHVKELVAQNVQALLRVWPQAPVGINSAGLGRRDKHSQILFGSIQSLAREDHFSIGKRDLILVDEAHLIPRSGDGQYLTLINKLREGVPDLRVAGFSATCYRLDSGRLDEGDGRLFTDVVYSYDIARGVADGFLSPLMSRLTGTQIDVSKVARRGGEFVAGALEAAANVDRVTQAACNEIVERGEGRRSWLAFCAGVAHAEAVRDALRQRGIHAEMVTGETPGPERDRLIRDFKAGRIRCLTNANVLTTGFDAPGVDMIAMLRPTLSTSLYVQMLGRGTRLAEGKENCLVLDFAENVRRHGPVDAVEVGSTGKGKGTGKVDEASVRAKACPDCETLVSLNTFECPYCGHEWERPKTPKHRPEADTEVAVMSREITDRWLPIKDARAFPHQKEGSPPSARVEYMAGLSTYREWVMFEHTGYPRAKAHKWWRSIVGTPVPATTEEAIGRFTREAKIAAVKVVRDGKYWRVNGWRVQRPDGRLFQVNEKLDIAPVPLKEMGDAT